METCPNPAEKHTSLIRYPNITCNRKIWDHGGSKQYEYLGTRAYLDRFQRIRHIIMPGLLMKAEEEHSTTPADLRLAGSDDAIYTIDELIKRRASEYEDSPLLCFPKESLTDYEEHSARAIDRFVDAAVGALQQRGLEPAVGGN
jgi:hypothetical protein